MAAAPERAMQNSTLVATGARWERRLQHAVLVLARIGLAYMFFTQLWWKAPPAFGCGADFAFTSGTPSQLQRTRGLCDWIGIEYEGNRMTEYEGVAAAKRYLDRLL